MNGVQVGAQGLLRLGRVNNARIAEEDPGCKMAVLGVSLVRSTEIRVSALSVEWRGLD